MVQNVKAMKKATISGKYVQILGGPPFGGGGGVSGAVMVICVFLLSSQSPGPTALTFIVYVFEPLEGTGYV